MSQLWSGASVYVPDFPKRNKNFLKATYCRKRAGCDEKSHAIFMKKLFQTEPALVHCLDWKISLIIITIGAERGRAARGGPGVL